MDSNPHLETLSLGELAGHTHTRGTMEISGKVYGSVATSAGSDTVVTGLQNGAFLQEVLWSNKDNWSASGAVAGGIVSFAASRSWSGSTSEEGMNETHNNLPPFVIVHIWKRIN